MFPQIFGMIDATQAVIVWKDDDLPFGFSAGRFFGERPTARRSQAGRLFTVIHDFDQTVS
ncbi:hypothetical protein [Methylobacterium sp. A54F]